MTVNRKLRMGMIGGGQGAFIGEVHRKAARMDGLIEIVSGVFSRDAKNNRATGKEVCLDTARVYKNVQAMIKAETDLPKDKRIDFVVITTPNDSHFAMTRDFLKAGFHVMLEKPMTMTSAEAKTLARLVKQKKLVLGLMHNYCGYPMVKLAKDMVAKNRLGSIRKVVVQYPQGWLSTALEKTGAKQAVWRTDPKQSGAGGCVGDIGTHAANLAEYVTGLRITDVCAELTTFVKGRKLDDDCNCLLKFNNGAKGILHASQISIGQENNLAIWVHGEKASLEWYQELPNHVSFRPLGQPEQIWKRGNDYIGTLSKAAAENTRLPFGHPEAFLEAFANHYVNFARTVQCSIAGKKADAVSLDFPGAQEGVRGMLFIETVVASTKSKQKWTKMRQ